MPPLQILLFLGRQTFRELHSSPVLQFLSSHFTPDQSMLASRCSSSSVQTSETIKDRSAVPFSGCCRGKGDNTVFCCKRSHLLRRGVVVSMPLSDGVVMQPADFQSSRSCCPSSSASPPPAQMPGYLGFAPAWVKLHPEALSHRFSIGGSSLLSGARWAPHIANVDCLLFD